MNKRLSLSITPTCSTSSGLANRRRNNKNLSLCLSPESTSQLLNVPQFHQPKQQKDDVNAYPLGPAKIMPFLYLGSEKNALDLDHLKQLNVQAILNVAAEVNNPYEYLFQSMDDLLSSSIVPSPSLSKASSVSSTASSIQTFVDSPLTPPQQSVAYQKLPWQHNQDNLAVELSKAIDIIDRARNAGQTILVHCQCGVARSATVIIAYIMKTYNMPMQDAYNHVKHLAPPISPNLGLLFQLREFEQKIRPTVAPAPEQEVPPTPTVALTPQAQQPQPQPQPQPVAVAIGRNHSYSGRPKSWIGSTHSAITASPSELTSKPKKNTFLIRASSLCLTGAWKRKLKPKPAPKNDNQQQQQQQQQGEEDGWWKARKVSVDTTASVCC
ncbi:tyrosine/serine/threonine protein phosphatase [Mucor circinelloides]